MKKQFIINQADLLPVLASMQPICAKRTAVDATSMILFSAGHRELILKSTDLEISLQASCVLKQSTIDEQSSFLVSGKRIFDIVRELDGDITCTIEGAIIALSCGDVRLTLNIKDAQEFPPFPERIENLMQWDSAFALEMLNKVAFLIPQNNVSPALNGLFLEISPQELKMTATDGHCLAQVSSRTYTLGESKKWLLPRRAVFELKKILETTPASALFLGVCGNQVVFSGLAFNFFTKVLVDAFPQYMSILDKNGFVPATIDRGDFVKTLRRSSCLLSGQFLATKFEFADNKVHVSLHNKDVGKLEEQLSVQGYDQDKLELRFYAPYLLNGLQVLHDADAATFYLKNATRPMIFESTGNDLQFTYLVMPVSPTAGA